MRIALLSAVRTVSTGALAALAPFLGRTVLAAQFDSAIELGAERIVCLAHSQAAEILTLQQEAEQRGVDFHLISGHLALAGLLKADQELIVFQDGLLIDRAAIASELKDQRGVLVLPANAALSAGFERIDAEWAWAGLLIARGDVAAKLADLPSDSDPASLLLRLALQARVPLNVLDSDHLSAGKVMLIDNGESLTKHEALILNGSIEERSWAGPGTKLAGLAIRSMLPKALEWSGKLTVGVSALAIGAMVLVSIGYAASGGVILVLAAFIFAALKQVDTLLKRVSNGVRSAFKLNFISILFDISIVIFLSISLWQSMSLSSLALAPTVLGLSRLAGIIAQGNQLPIWQDFWQDRALLMLCLTVGIYWDTIVPILATLSLAMLAFALICEEGKANSRPT